MVKAAFFVYPTAFQTPGGGEVQLLKTKEYLEKEGAEVKLFDQWTDRMTDYDIFHTFGSVKECLNAVRTAKHLGVKTVLSTICWYNWRSAWFTYTTPKERWVSISRHAAKTFAPWLPSMRKSMMQHSDLLFPNSESEARQLELFFQVPKEKIFVIPNGVDESFRDARPGLFEERYGLKNFILCAGRIEPRKNQLNMIRALKGIAPPLVFVGDYVPAYRDYYETCRREAGKNVHFLGRIPHDAELLKSAYAAANTFLLASWLETPGLAALEAGLAGAKVVITREGATREYFGDRAAYVSPHRLSDIRSVTLKTFERAPDPALKEHILKNYLWSAVARKTLQGYRLLLDRKDGGKRRPSKKIFSVGIDVQATAGKVTGLGVYTKNLVSALIREGGSEFSFEFYRKGYARDLNTLERLWWTEVSIPRILSKDGVDLLHIPAFAPPRLTKRKRTVVTVHDLIGMRYPNQLGAASRYYWGQWLPAAMKNADAFIVQSEFTKSDTISHLRIPESRIRVIHPSGHEAFRSDLVPEKIREVRTRLGLGERYFLAVGTLEPRKNFDRLAAAFRVFKDAHPEYRDYQLGIVGSLDFAHGNFSRELIRTVGRSPDIHFTGYVETETLNLLYAGARAFVFPSLYEGFGIPLLEAMASGTAVIASQASSIPEVAGEAAQYVDPADAESIAAAMKRLARDDSRRAELIQKGFARIRDFSWTETARRTLDVYRSLLS
ncbi:MAG: glycosyltransferase [Candidatus Omnitrophica bacterium]|nr:glycosyltransferase [Candidatus Omnitrophota bacterium]